MKFALSFVLILALATNTLAHTVIYGKRSSEHQLLYRANIIRPAIEGFSHDVYVSYPKDGEPKLKKHISAILFNNNKNSSAQPVMAYDVDKDWSHLDSASIIVRGQLSQGIDATVEFYGYDV